MKKTSFPKLILSLVLIFPVGLIMAGCQNSIAVSETVDSGVVSHEPPKIDVPSISIDENNSSVLCTEQVYTQDKFAKALPPTITFEIIPDTASWNCGELLACSADGDELYLIARDDLQYSESLWYWDGREAQRIYAPGGWIGTLPAPTGDFIYLCMTADDNHVGLYRISCGGDTELIRENILSYQLIGNSLLLHHNGMLSVCLKDDSEHEVTLWKNTDEIFLSGFTAADNGVLFALYAKTDDCVTAHCLYWQTFDGARTLLDYNDGGTQSGYSDLQLYDGCAYFRQGQDIYRIDLKYGEKSLCLRQNNSNCYFVAHNGLLYLFFYGDIGRIMTLNLDTGELTELAEYDSRNGQYALDTMKPLSLVASDRYLYLQGYSYSWGGQLVTRIPLSNGDFQENIFFDGQWMTTVAYDERMELAGLP